MTKNVYFFKINFNSLLDLRRMKKMTLIVVWTHKENVVLEI